MKPNEAFFYQNPKFLGSGSKFWGIWGYFDQFINTHFGTVSLLSMFSINQPLFLQKTKPLYSRSNFFGVDWDLNLGRKELGIYSFCVRSP